MAFKLFQFLKDSLHFLLGLIPISLLLLLSYAVHIPALIYRSLNRLTARFLRPDLVPADSLSSMALTDRMFETPTFNISNFGYCTGKLTVETLIEVSDERVWSRKNLNGHLEYQRLRQYPVNFGGIFYWKDDPDFDIRNHIRYLEKPKDSEGQKVSLADISRLMSDAQGKPWAHNRSPWEVIVINNVEPEHHFVDETGVKCSEYSVFAFVIHHSLGDGYSIIKLLQCMSDIKDSDVFAAVPSFRKPKGCAGFLTQLALPFKLVTEMTKFLMYRSPNDNNALNTHKLKTAYYVTALRSIEVDRVKRVKKKFVVPFQTVLNALVAGALRRLLLDRGQKVPKRMTAFLPLPLPKHPGGMVIHAGAATLKISTGRSESKDRLDSCDKHLRYAATSTIPIIGVSQLKCAGLWPAPILRVLSVKASRGFTLAISCVPATKHDVRFRGHRIFSGYSCVGPWDSEAGVTVLSTTLGNRLYFTFNFEKTLCPEDLDLLRSKLDQYMEEELQALESLDVEFSEKDKLSKTIV